MGGGLFLGLKNLPRVWRVSPLPPYDNPNMQKLKGQLPSQYQAKMYQIPFFNRTSTVYQSRMTFNLLLPVFIPPIHQKKQKTSRKKEKVLPSKHNWVDLKDFLVKSALWILSNTFSPWRGRLFLIHSIHLNSENIFIGYWDIYEFMI